MMIIVFGVIESQLRLFPSTNFLLRTFRLNDLRPQCSLLEVETLFLESNTQLLCGLTSGDVGGE